MRVYYIIILLCINLLSCHEKEIEFDACESSHNTKSLYCLVLKNNSNLNYAFYNTFFGDNNNWGYNADAKIYIQDQNGKSPEANNIYIDERIPNSIEMKKFLENEKKDSILWKDLLKKDAKVSYEWFKKYKSLIKSRIILFPNKKYNFSKNIFFFKNQLQSSGTYYSFDKNKKYFIQIELTFDSIKIKDRLTINDLDSLKKNKIKIFHGKLKTEKTPLIIE